MSAEDDKKTCETLITGTLVAVKDGNYAKAAELTEAAAELGDTLAMEWLGGYYLKGQGVPQDYAKAAKWFEKAAKRYSSKAKYELGRLYFTGQGVPQDYEKAVKLLREAAANNIKEAKDFLPKAEAEEAAEKLRKAAEQGNVDAQFNVGRSYYTGDGVTPQNYEKAAEWFGKAVAQGHAEAKDWLAKVEAAIEEEKAREAEEATERAAKEKRRKIGRIAAPLLAVFSIIPAIVSGEGAGFGVSLVLSIPFLVLYFSSSERKILRWIFLCGSVLLNLFMLFIPYEEGSGFFRTIIFFMCISNMASCITAMIFPRR